MNDGTLQKVPNLCLPFGYVLQQSIFISCSSVTLRSGITLSPASSRKSKFIKYSFDEEINTKAELSEEYFIGFGSFSGISRIIVSIINHFWITSKLLWLIFILCSISLQTSYFSLIKELFHNKELHTHQRTSHSSRIFSLNKRLLTHQETSH